MKYILTILIIFVYTCLHACVCKFHFSSDWDEAYIQVKQGGLTLGVISPTFNPTQDFTPNIDIEIVYQPTKIAEDNIFVLVCDNFVFISGILQNNTTTIRLDALREDDCTPFGNIKPPEGINFKN